MALNERERQRERSEWGCSISKGLNTSKDTLKSTIKLQHSVIPFCDLSKAGNHCSHEMEDIFINSCGPLKMQLTWYSGTSLPKSTKAPISNNTA